MDVDLISPMKPCVIHLAEQGAYEFITADKPVIHRDCGSYTLLLDMDSGEAIGVQWPDGIKRPEHSAVGLEERVAAALSAPVEDGEIEGLIAECSDFAAACGAREPGDGAFEVRTLVGVGSEQTERNLRAVLREAATALRSLSARLAEAERERDEAEERAENSQSAEIAYAVRVAQAEPAVERLRADLSKSVSEADRLGWEIVGLKKELTDAIARAEKAEAERDRLAGLVMKHWKGNCFGGVDHADAREIRAALASRLKAEGGANG